MGYDVKDISLAPQGKLQIEWAEKGEKKQRNATDGII